MGEMTAEERARSICRWPGHVAGLPAERCKECKNIAAEIRAAVAAEREECARVADKEEGWLLTDYDEPGAKQYCGCGYRIGSAIRARGEK